MSGKARRGVSQILGILIMLGVVAVVGGVLLINGIQIMTDFNADLNARAERGGEKIQEKIILTHVRFFMDEIAGDEVGEDDEDDSDGDDGPGGEDPDVVNEPVARLYIMNVGDTDTYISSITIINQDQQTLECCTSSDRTYLPLLTPVKVQVKLNTNFVVNENYKVSIVTENDNSFTRTVKAPNG